MKSNCLDDTIVAISTPVGEGGIGIVRMSGKDALTIADKIFLSKNGSRPSQFSTYTTHYGYVIDRRASCVNAVRSTPYAVRNTNHEIIDEIILTVMRSPKSYTKEDIVEINCHGGIIPLRKVLTLVLNFGARLAEPGEFTKRAFLNGRIDLLQAEAVLDVIRSKTEAGLRVALSQLEGELSKEIRKLKNEIMDFYIHIEASIDFPEEDIQIFNSIELSKKIKTILKKLKGLLDTSENGKVLREGISTVICGKANVGKSTLMNALLREKRVIVSPIPGTTRDIIEEIINISGIPLKVSDTAGIIEPSNLIDKESAERTKMCIKGADLILLLLDNSEELTAQDKIIIDIVKNKNFIVVINKADLPNKLNIDGIKRQLNAKTIVKISATNRTNLGALEKAILEMVWSGQILFSHQALITNIRHIHALKRAYESMQNAKGSLSNGLSPEFIAIDIKETLHALGEITGETIVEDLLDRIFQDFCIGK